MEKTVRTKQDFSLLKVLKLYIFVINETINLFSSITGFYIAFDSSGEIGLFVPSKSNGAITSFTCLVVCQNIMVSALEPECFVAVMFEPLNKKERGDIIDQ